MVQVRAPKSLASQAGLKRSHVKTESRLYCQRQKQQHTRSRGGGDIKIPSPPPPPMPNYMKPTISSDARKENLLATTTIHSRPAAAAAEKKICSRNNKQQYYCHSSKATCSSTLKGSKFPKSLDLIAGGTEAEGSSVPKVCPYAYCSLNGHHHQPPLPPLKLFVSAMRKSLKNQKTIELEEEKEQMIKIEEDGTETPHVLCHEDEDGADQNSEPSDEDMYEYNNLLEYLECDQRVEEVHVPVEKSERVPTTVEEVESSLPRNRSERSEHSDEGFGLQPLPTPYCEEEEEAPEDDVVAASSPSGAFSLDPDNAELRREVENGVAERIDATSLHDVDSVLESSEEAVSEEPEDETEITIDGPEAQVLVVHQPIEEGDVTSSSSVALHSDSCDNFTEPEQATAEGDHIKTKPDMQNCDEMKARMRIVPKKKTEEREETKEFNPRGPRFLAAEPDPEAEKVDLRHQTMDEKKNSEEWMIDYALRQALVKLAPAPKRKVSLLVQAFESVTPLHDWERALQRATSGFGHARIIQACN